MTEQIEINIGHYNNVIIKKEAIEYFSVVQIQL